MGKYRYLRGSENNAESVEFDLHTSVDTTCVINVDLLSCGVRTAPCGNGEDVALTLGQVIEVLKFVKEEREKIITGTYPKSRESWHESGINSFGEYFRVGDEVTEELVDYFMDLLPPAHMGYGILQVGEPYSTELDPDTGKYRNTYTTFVKGDGKWRYVGECFYKQETDRVKHESGIDRALKEAEEEKERGR